MGYSFRNEYRVAGVERPDHARICCMAAFPAPTQIAAALERHVVGQKHAVREMSVALAKKLAQLRVGNILMIGSSGSGKTTLMRAVEAVLAQNPALALRSAPRGRG